MRNSIGIDFGTTNTLVSLHEESETVIIPNDRGKSFTPSVVSISKNGEILVGDSAVHQAAMDPDNTVFAVKRIIGTDRTVKLGRTEYTPEECAGFIFSKIKKDVQAWTGETIQHAIVSVPAYFDEIRRRGICRAARLGGLKVIKLINEPAAAALVHTLNEKTDSTCLVYDLGGGTFDCSVLTKKRSSFTVLASRGDNHLGGIDFNKAVFDHIKPEFIRQTGIDPSRDPLLLYHVMSQIEKAKIELSTRKTADMRLPFTGFKKNNSIHFKYTLTCELFENIICGYIEKTLTLVKGSLRDASVDIGQINSLVLSGGSTRIPLIRRKLQELLGIQPVSRINPEEVVAKGAAVLSGLADKKQDEKIFTDITPLSLGVEIDTGQFVPVIPRNSKLPAIESRIFTTVIDNQSSVEIHVIQGNSKSAGKNISLGRFMLNGIRPAGRGIPRINVLFTVDTDGMLTVSARDLDTNLVQQVTISSYQGGGDSNNNGTAGGRDMRRCNSLKTKIRISLNKYEDQLEPDFIQEIRRTVLYTEKKLTEQKNGDISDMLMSLETLYGELNSHIFETEYVNERA